MRAPIVPARRIATLWIRFIGGRLRDDDAADTRLREKRSINHKGHEGDHSKGFGECATVIRIAAVKATGRPPSRLFLHGQRSELNCAGSSAGWLRQDYGIA